MDSGLFHRAILMSGSAMSDWAASNQSLQLTTQIAQSLNCPLSDHEEDDALLSCLRQRRWVSQPTYCIILLRHLRFYPLFHLHLHLIRLSACWVTCGHYNHTTMRANAFEHSCPLSCICRVLWEAWMRLSNLLWHFNDHDINILHFDSFTESFFPPLPPCFCLYVLLNDSINLQLCRVAFSMRRGASLISTWP